MSLAEHYVDPRLVQLYDSQNPLGADSDFYLRLAGRPAMAVLDIGCGTGLLTAAFAAAGHAATGVDPAAAMLSVARQRVPARGAAALTWIEGTAEDLPGAQRFDLAIMTGHAFQVLLTDQAIMRTMAAARRLLRPGGVFAFETRNPAARAWEAWTPAHADTRIVPGLGRVRSANEVLSVDGEHVRFATTYELADGTTLASRSTLRFAPQATLQRLLEQSGFRDIAWSGGWDGGPVGAASRELIAVAR